MDAAFETSLREAGETITRLLDDLMPVEDSPRGRVVDAMRYAALAGGKRLRPYLVLSSASLFDVPATAAQRTGAAVEMIHCYSLIHDDLPAIRMMMIMRNPATSLRPDPT